MPALPGASYFANHTPTTAPQNTSRRPQIDPRRTGCLAHIRRKFSDLCNASSEVTVPILIHIQRMKSKPAGPQVPHRHGGLWPEKLPNRRTARATAEGTNLRRLRFTTGLPTNAKTTAFGRLVKAEPPNWCISRYGRNMATSKPSMRNSSRTISRESWRSMAYCVSCARYSFIENLPRFLRGQRSKRTLRQILRFFLAI